MWGGGRRRSECAPDEADTVDWCFEGVVGSTAKFGGFIRVRRGDPARWFWRAGGGEGERGSFLFAGLAGKTAAKLGL